MDVSYKFSRKYDQMLRKPEAENKQQENLILTMFQLVLINKKFQKNINKALISKKLKRDQRKRFQFLFQ